MLFLRRYFTSLLICFLSLSGQVCAAGQPQQIYRVGTHGDDIVTQALFDAIAAELHINVEYVPFVNFPSIVSAVEKGDVDFMANIIYTPERAEKLDFTSPTNIEYTYNYTYQPIMDANPIVAVPKGALFYQHVMDNMPNVTLKKYTNIQQAKKWLDQDKVDGVVGLINDLKFMTQDGARAVLQNYRRALKPVSIATTKGQHQLLLAEIDTFIHDNQIQKMLRKSVAAYHFELKKEMLRKQILTAGFNADNPVRFQVENAQPFGLYHADGSVSGIVADVISQSCQLMAIKCQLTSKADDHWSSMLTNLESHQVDVVGPISISSERQKDMYFSHEIFEKHLVMVKRQGYKDQVYDYVAELFAERVGVVQGGVHDKLMQRLLPNKKLVYFTDTEAMFSALLNNQVDYIAVSENSYHTFLNQIGSRIPLVIDDKLGAFESFSLALAFPKTKQGKKLAALFNEAIDMIDVAAIRSQYDHGLDWKQLADKEKQKTKWVTTFVLFIIVILGLFFYSWRKQSVTDTLTKLHNRFALQRKYSKGLKRGQILVYFDVNKFKSINDGYGHSIGDEVLKRIADNIKYYWPYHSYRLGGDEFVLIGYETNFSLKEIMRDIGFFNHKIDSQTQCPVTISYGVYRSLGETISIEEMLHLSDSEMYKHKKKAA